MLLLLIRHRKINRPEHVLEIERFPLELSELILNSLYELSGGNHYFEATGWKNAATHARKEAIERPRYFSLE
jgi:hypothetical protein